VVSAGGFQLLQEHVPVLPTTPILSLGLMKKVTLFNTVGRSDLYRMVMFSTEHDESRAGHEAGGSLPLLVSRGIDSVYSKILKRRM